MQTYLKLIEQKYNMVEDLEYFGLRNTQSQLSVKLGRLGVSRSGKYTQVTLCRIFRMWQQNVIG